MSQVLGEVVADLITGEKVLALVWDKKWELLDALVDEIKFDGLENTDDASLRVTRAAGVVLGVLARGPASERASFKNLVARLRAKLEEPAVSQRLALVGISVDDFIAMVLAVDVTKIRKTTDDLAKRTETP